MKRMVAVIVPVCILLCACFACAALAEPRTYTYGGSGNDSLDELAVSADGRIVLAGYTNSSDGTLAGRTKTGRSGWALCIDTQGEVLWSFCTRLGDHDTVRLPRFHEDGSVTLALQAEWVNEGQQEIELIRLDGSGEVVWRKTLEKTDGGEKSYVTLSHLTEEGYVVDRDDARAQSTGSALYGFDGELLRELGPVPGHRFWARGEHHVLRDSGNMRVLFYVDALGSEIEMEARDIPRSESEFSDIRSLVSLPDGGAVGVGYAYRDTANKGLIVRWDAQGNRVFEWWMEGEAELYSVIRTQEGFAALAKKAGMAREDADNWQLVTFGQDGVKRGSVALGNGASMVYDPFSKRVAQLPDASFVAVQGVGGSYNEDARVVIVQKGDIQ